MLMLKIGLGFSVKICMISRTIPNRNIEHQCLKLRLTYFYFTKETFCIVLAKCVLWHVGSRLQVLQPLPAVSISLGSPDFCWLFDIMCSGCLNGEVFIYAGCYLVCHAHIYS